MSKIESSAGKALYEQQETKLSQQSAAFIELLTKRGILGDSSIDDDRVRQAKKEKKKSMYHNTLLLLQHYRTILWTLECFPSSVAEELDRPLKDLDTLLDRIDLELGMNNRKLEGRMESVRRSRLLVDRLNDAVSILKSKPVNQVFKSWCRMVGSQLLLLVMNVWFIRGFNSSAGQYIGNGGALSTGQGSIFLWLFCALAFLKTAQKFDSYMAAMGLNVAQTGSSMGMELLMAARVISGVGHSAKSAGSVFGRGGSTATGTGAAASGFASGFASRFKGNSYVRDAVVDGGTRMGMGGGVGFVGRVFGGVAARNGAMLMGESIASVAARPAEAAGTIAGDIADRSLGNYMPQLAGHTLKGTQISGGHISTTATGTDGKVSSVEMFNTAQFEKPAAPHSVVTATDGSTWYQMASGEGRNAFYDAPGFTGSPAESEQVAAAFPGAAEGTVLRNTGDGIMEAGSESGNSLWYNSAYYNEPEAPHTVMQAANGVDWYAMQQHAEAPAFEQGEAADTYNQAAFRNFMPGFEQQVAHVDGTHREDGHFEVRHADGSGTAFYDTARFAAPRGDYQVYEDVRGQQWIAIHGDPAVERKPVFEDGKPVYDGENVRTVSVESVRYKNMPSRFKEPEKRPDSGIKAPKRRK